MHQAWKIPQIKFVYTDLKIYLLKTIYFGVYKNLTKNPMKQVNGENYQKARPFYEIRYLLYQKKVITYFVWIFRGIISFLDFDNDILCFRRSYENWYSFFSMTDISIS